MYGMALCKDTLNQGVVCRTHYNSTVVAMNACPASSFYIVVVMNNLVVIGLLFIII